MPNDDKPKNTRWGPKVWFAVVWLALAMILMVLLIVATIGGAGQTPVR